MAREKFVKEFDIIGDIIKVKDEVATQYAFDAIEQLETHKKETAVHNFNTDWMHVDPNLGSDENDGTDGKPFKTLDRAIDELNRGRNDVRIFLDRAGEYTFSKAFFNGVGLHIHAGNTRSDTPAYTPELYIVRSVARDSAGSPIRTVVYNSHINFKGITLDTPTTTFCYADNTLWTTDHCIFKCPRWQINGGAFSSTNDSYEKLFASSANGYVSNIHITNTDYNQRGMYFAECTVGIAGTITYDRLPAQGTTESNCALQVEKSTIHCSASFTDHTLKYYHSGIYCRDSIFISANTRFTEFQDLGANVRENVRTLRVIGNAVVGG